MFVSSYIFIIVFGWILLEESFIERHDNLVSRLDELEEKLDKIEQINNDEREELFFDETDKIDKIEKEN